MFCTHTTHPSIHAFDSHTVIRFLPICQVFRKTCCYDLVSKSSKCKLVIAVTNKTRANHMVKVVRQVTLGWQWRRSWKAAQLSQWAIEICNGSPKFKCVGQNDWILIIVITRTMLFIRSFQNTPNIKTF